MTGSRANGARSNDRASWLELLRAGAGELGVTLSDAQFDRLLDYVALLAKWNAVYNLTAIRDPRQMLIQHILDSLSIMPHPGTPGDAERYRAEKVGVPSAGEG